jgi:outer membrane protein assembly factor BamB
MEGNVYLCEVEHQTFFAIGAQRQLLWTNSERSGRRGSPSWLSLSPDGRQVYTVVLGAEATHLIAFDAQTGVIVWEVPVDWYAVSPAVDAYGNLYCVRKGYARKPVLACFGPDGSVRWESSRPVSPGVNIAIAEDGRIYAPAEGGGELLCFDGEGHLLWSVRLLFAFSGDQAALVVDSEGVVYFAVDKTVEAFDRDGRRLFVSEMPGYARSLHAMAIPCPGRLIVVGDAQLWCIK